MESAVAEEGAPSIDLVCAAPREPNSPCTSDTYDAPLATARPAATNATDGPSDITENPPTPACYSANWRSLRQFRKVKVKPKGRALVTGWDYAQLLETTA